MCYLTMLCISVLPLVIPYESIVYYAFFTARSILIKSFFGNSGRVLSIRKYINVIFLFSLLLGLLTDIAPHIFHYNQT